MKTITVNEITVNEAMTLINETKGKTFSARFVKKDGTLRDMNCRLGVKKHLKGGKMAYDARSRQLIPVFDMQKEAYRMINAKTLIEINANGKVYKIK